MKLLIVDDDRDTTAALSTFLTARQFTVDIASDGQSALELVETVPYDLIVLDVMLPDGDGISLCRAIRQRHQTVPILLLTAKDEVGDRVSGLEAGADDYLTKPYDPSELLARIRALLRRGNTPITEVLCWGNLQLDPHACEVTYQGNLIKLTPKEYKLLELFLRYPRRIFDRRTLLDRVWSMDEYPGEEAVTTQIRGLRRKLQAAGLHPDPIETLYGLGYRLRTLEPEHHQPPLQEAADSGKAEAVAAIGQMWQEFQGRLQEQLTILDTAIQGLAAQTLVPEKQQQAQAIAHRLVGSLGAYGLSQAATLARQIEQSFKASPNSANPTPATGELTTLLQQLRSCTAQSPPFASQVISPFAHASTPDPHAPLTSTILAIDPDPTLLKRLQTDAPAWGFRLETAPDLTTARQQLQSLTPDAVILDLHFPHTSETGFTLLTQLKRQVPHLPILILTEHSDLPHRLEATRLGANAFLQKPATASDVFPVLNQLLNLVNPIAAKLLIVDDDPHLLALLQTQLQPWGFQIATLTNPHQFWQVLEATRPDLLLLDVSMPEYSGIDLCQVVRCDPRWSQIPILFLSAHSDADILHCALAVGADDYVLKPIVEADLIRRILKRLGRISQSRPVAERQSFQEG